MIRHGMQIPRTATICLTPTAKSFLNKPWTLQISLFCESNKPPHKRSICVAVYEANLFRQVIPCKKQHLSVC